MAGAPGTALGRPNLKGSAVAGVPGTARGPLREWPIGSDSSHLATMSMCVGAWACV